MNQSVILPREFYTEETQKVAKDLLGKLLVRDLDGERLSGIIVETEAYRGFDDTASHAHKGPTERCKVMYGEAGHAYIYLTYGIHNMLNFVTEKKFFPSAVLIRAIEPVEGIAKMFELRGVESKKELTSGPAKITESFQIDRELNGIDVTGKSSIWVEEPERKMVYPERSRRVLWLDGYEIKSSPRIGIDYADKWSRSRKWRFFVKGNEFVSR